MATLTTAPGTTHGASPAESTGTPRQLRAVEQQARRKRQVPWMVAGLLLVAGSALGFALWAESQSARTDVLVAARSLEAGAIVEFSDLRIASIALEPDVAHLPATEVNSVVGLTAQTSVAPGALVHRTSFGSSVPLAEGRAIVGATLVAGEFPLSGLRAGDLVLLHAVADLSASGAAASGSLGEAQVWSVEEVDNVSERRLFVSLDVSTDQVAAVMDAAAHGRLRLGLVGGQ